jgi:transcription antitermination factor NusA-like protein
MKGVRIHTIVRELNNENIDVINFSDQPEVFIQRSLAPAKLKSVEVSKEARTANVLVGVDQVSLAIGRNGQNIRLASKLTGYEINLIKEGVEDEYDIELVDFKEELGDDLYFKLINAGLETAKDVINAKFATLLSIEGLDEEKVRELREMMRRDLEEAEVEDEETDEEEEEEEEEEEKEEEAEEKEEEEKGKGQEEAGEQPVEPKAETPAEESPQTEEPAGEKDTKGHE